MAAPEHVPVDRTQPVRAYESPPRRPESWLADRPGEVVEDGQPRGDRLGNQGPDQGYMLCAGPPVRGQAHAHRRRAREGRPGRRRRRRAEASVAVRAGAGDPRPHRRPHGVGLPRRGARQGAGRPAQAAVRGGVAPAPLRGAAPHRRPGPGADAAADPRATSPRSTGATGAASSATSPPPPTDRGLPEPRPVPSGGDHRRPSPALRALAHGLPARRQRPGRAVQLARGAAHRWGDAPARRGHRPRALQLRAGREHPRLAPLARPRLGRRHRLPGRQPRGSTARRRSACSATGAPTGATAPPSRSRPGPRSAAARRATTATAAIAASSRGRPPRCGSACPTTAPRPSPTSCAAR